MKSGSGEFRTRLSYSSVRAGNGHTSDAGSTGVATGAGDVCI